MNDFLLFGSSSRSFEIIPISGISRIKVDKNDNEVEIYLSNGDRLKRKRHQFDGATRSISELDRLIYPEQYEDSLY